MSEHDEQVALFKWIDLKCNSDWRYKNIYAIPNGARTSISVAKRLKAEGLRTGVLDVNVDIPSGGYHGMRLEMKFGKNTTSGSQKDWIARYQRAGYYAVVCWSYESAKAEIERYLDSAEPF